MPSSPSTALGLRPPSVCFYTFVAPDFSIIVVYTSFVLDRFLNNRPRNAHSVVPLSSPCRRPVNARTPFTCSSCSANYSRAANPCKTRIKLDRVSAFVVAEGQTRPSLRTRVRKTHLVGPRTTESAYFVLFEGHTVRNSSAVHNTAVFADDRNETERTYGNSKKNRSDRRLVARPKDDGVYRTRRIRRDDTNFPFRVRAPRRPTAPRTGQNARNRLRRETLTARHNE